MVCYKWVKEADYCIHHYNKKRPTPKIQDYNPPGIGVAYGDPHYRTFDGLEYLFNGRGEFWILRVNTFHSVDDIAIQGRFAQPPKEASGGEINATVISGIALQEGYAVDLNQPRAEFHLNFDDAFGDHAMLVFVNGVLQDFSDEDMRIQEFHNTEQTRRLIIMNNSPENEQSNFTVVFQNGVAAQISSNHRNIHIMVVLPEKYFDKTDGLLGDWDDDSSNDLRNAHGEVIDPDIGPQGIHERFGMTWEIKSDQSRFTYRARLNYEYYRDPDFIPLFEEPMPPIWPPEGSDITEEDVDEACGPDFVCRFDFKTTLKREVGVESLHTHNWTKEVSKMATPIHTCGRPEVEHAIFEYDNYLVAGMVTFTGCEEGYTLRGPTDFRCETSESPVTASWEPNMDDVVCKSNQEIKDEDAKLAAAIAVPICMVFVIAGVSVGGYFYMKRRKQNAGPKDPPTKTGSDRPTSMPPGPPMVPPDDLNTSKASIGSANHPTTFTGPMSNPAYGSHESINSQVSITGAGDLGVAAPENHSGRSTPTPVSYFPISMNPGYDNAQRTSQISAPSTPLPQAPVSGYDNPPLNLNPAYDNGRRPSQTSGNRSGQATPVSQRPVSGYDNPPVNLNPAYQNSMNELRASQTSLNIQPHPPSFHGSRQSLHSMHTDTEV
jgi:hypothetical protein